MWCCHFKEIGMVLYFYKYEYTFLHCLWSGTQANPSMKLYAYKKYISSMCTISTIHKRNCLSLSQTYSCEQECHLRSPLLMWPMCRDMYDFPWPEESPSVASSSWMCSSPFISACRLFRRQSAEQTEQQTWPRQSKGWNKQNLLDFVFLVSKVLFCSLSDNFRPYPRLQVITISVSAADESDE